MTPMLKLSFLGLFIYVRYLKTVPSALEMIEIIFTIPLTIYNSSEQINSGLFSRAKSSPRLVIFVKCSPRLVNLNSLNFDMSRCNTSRGFRGLFVHCICSKNDSFLSVFTKAAFLSFAFFLQIINCML